MARLKLILVYSIITLFILFAICMESCTKIEYIIVEKKTTDTLIVFVSDSSKVIADTPVFDVIIDTIIDVNEDPFEAITDTIFLNDTLPSIKIGNQTWASVNLDLDHFNDGSPIKHGYLNQDWDQNEPAYSYWLNDSSLNNVYGKLYNWYAVETGKLCPVGWRVPTVDDFKQLESFLGIDTACGKLKEKGYAHWMLPNAYATDDYGFRALPGQLRWYNGHFWPINAYTDQRCVFWTSSIDNEADLPIYVGLYNAHATLTYYRHSRNNGYSVRCIKN